MTRFGYVMTTSLAVLAVGGPFEPVLQLVIAYEHGDWDGVSALTSRLGLDEQEAPQRYREAVEWARVLTQYAA